MLYGLCDACWGPDGLTGCVQTDEDGWDMEQFITMYFLSRDGLHIADQWCNWHDLYEPYTSCIATLHEKALLFLVVLHNWGYHGVVLSNEYDWYGMLCWLDVASRCRSSQTLRALQLPTRINIFLILIWAVAWQNLSGHSPKIHITRYLKISGVNLYLGRGQNWNNQAAMPWNPTQFTARSTPKWLTMMDSAYCCMSSCNLQCKTYLEAVWLFLGVVLWTYPADLVYLRCLAFR